MQVMVMLDMGMVMVMMVPQVTAIELEGAEGQESIMYDITLCELPE